MDQVKVGNYILKKRKDLGMTQKELAELVEVTDKSVSKWERGNGLPDVSRLKPLCDALKITMNELVAGEDIGEEGLCVKTEENIINLISESENQKRSRKVAFFVGVILAIVALLLLGISVSGSSPRSVFLYIDISTLLLVVLFIGIGVLLSKGKDKRAVVQIIRLLAIPSGVFVALVKTVFMLSNMSDLAALGPATSQILLSLMYSVGIYIIATVVKSHME